MKSGKQTPITNDETPPADVTQPKTTSQKFLDDLNDITPIIDDLIKGEKPKLERTKSTPEDLVCRGQAHGDR